MPWEPPSSAKIISTRPLDKGMRLDGPSNVIPEGSMLDSMNFISNLTGYRRRPGYDAFAAAMQVPYRMIDIMYAKDSTGVYDILLLTDTSLYVVDPIASFTEVAWAYNTGTITISGDNVTGNLTVWAGTILPGDLLRVGGLEARITVVTDNTHLSIDSGSLPNAPGGTAYSIQRTFYGGLTGIPQWINTPEGIAIADGKHELLWYVQSTNSITNWIDAPAKQPPDGPVIPCVVGYADDRVFIGYLNDDDGIDPQKVRWSGIADIHDFMFATNYNILQKKMGNIIKIITLQDGCMVYMQFGILFGMPTGLSTYPFAWRSMETGNFGLVGPNAISSYMGGHFIITQGGFYYVDSSSVGDIKLPQLKELSQSVKNALDVNAFDQAHAYVCRDTLNNSVIFGVVVDSSEKIGQLWRFDPRSASWSYDVISTEAVLDAPLEYNFPWTNLVLYTWNDIASTYPTWNSMNIGRTTVTVLTENGHALWRNSITNGIDFVSTPIYGRLLTKDHDFDAPDLTKTIVRLSIKVKEDTTRTVPITISVRGSINMGRNYLGLGTLTIPVDRDEGYVNFTLSGSTFRFEFTTTSTNETYTIIEYSLRVRGLGEELHTALQT